MTAPPVPYTWAVDQLLTASLKNTNERDVFRYLLGILSGQTSIVLGKPLETAEVNWGMRIPKAGPSAETKWFEFYSYNDSDNYHADGDSILFNWGIQDTTGRTIYAKLSAGRRDGTEEGYFWLTPREGDTFDTSNPMLYGGGGAAGVRTKTPTVSNAGFTGSGLNDLSAGGVFDFTAPDPIPKIYVVEVDATGTPDTFKWSDDGGATFSATGVSMTGSAQTLSYGVTITFAAATGHTLGDRWSFGAGFRFHVNGAIDADEIRLKGAILSAVSNWLLSGADIGYTTGRVGIGTTSPGQALDVTSGNIRTIGQLISTIATGTSPLSVLSETLVANLNSEFLKGANWQTLEFTGGGPNEFNRVAITWNLSTLATAFTLTAIQGGKYLVVVFGAAGPVSGGDTGRIMEVSALPGSGTFNGYAFPKTTQASGDYDHCLAFYRWVASAGATIPIQHRFIGGASGTTPGLVAAALIWIGP